MSKIVNAGKVVGPFPLAPGAKDTYTIDWTGYLAAGESVADVTFTEDAGLTVSGHSLALDVSSFYVAAAATAVGRLYVRALPDKGSGVGNPIAMAFDVALPRNA